MGSKGTKGNPEEQWIWPKKEPTEQEKIELVGRMVEIGVKILFQNPVYSFGGENYVPKEGNLLGYVEQGQCRDW